MNSIKNRDRELPKRSDSADLPRLLTERQAAAHLGVSAAYLRKARCEGTVGRRTPGPRFVRVGGRVLYPVGELDLWVASLERREVI